MTGLAEAEVPEDEVLQDPPVGQTTPVNHDTPSAVGDGFVDIPEGAGDEGIPFM